MPKIKSKTFGEVDVSDDQFIEFKEGLYGLAELKRFYLLDNVEPPFYWLQSADDENYAFIVLQPEFFKSDYELKVSNNDYRDIGLDLKSTDFSENILALVIVTIPKNEPENMTANLLGPIIVNKKKRIAKQTISLIDTYTTKYPILDELQEQNDIKVAQ